VFIDAFVYIHYYTIVPLLLMLDVVRNVFKVISFVCMILTYLEYLLLINVLVVLHMLIILLINC